MKKRIVITGASGFIGRGVAIELSNAGHEVICLTRHPEKQSTNPYYQWKHVPDYTDTETIAAAISKANLVIHLADNPVRLTNHKTRKGVEAATALIAAMQMARVKHLIFASSVYARLDAEGSTSTYGAHKRAIEDALLGAKDIYTIILRLPPVYGPNGRGGFAMLANLIQRGIPVPVGRAYAPRSYMALSNLTDLIRVLTDAAPQLWARHKGIYEPSDQQPLSTRSLAVAIGKAMSVSPKIIAVPAGVMKILGYALRKPDAISAPFTPLQTKSEPCLGEAFNWTPPRCIPATLDYLSSAD